MPKKKKKRDLLLPRMPFWDFATAEVVGINQPDQKVQLTPAQAALWKSYDRRVALNEEESVAYTQMTGKDPWKVGSKPPFNMSLALSRGAGKTLLCSMLSLYEALTNPYRAMPGERVAVLVLANLVDAAQGTLDYAGATAEDNPILKHFVDDVVAGEVRFKNGRKILAKASDSGGKSSRGPTALLAIVDEVAFLGEDGQDDEAFSAASASGRGNKGMRALIASSVNGHNNLLYEKHERYWGVENPLWEPFLGPVDIIRPEMRDDPDAVTKRMEKPEQYAREYECDFDAASDTEKVFDPKQLQRCIQPSITEVPPERFDAQYVCAIDASSMVKDGDRFAATILERTEDDRVRQVAVQSWDPNKDLISCQDIAHKVSAMCASYGLSVAHGDPHGGNWIVEVFKNAGIQLETHTTNQNQKLSRAGLIKELMATGRIDLLDDPQQHTELKEYVKTTLPSGAVKVDKPSTKDGADDYVDALGLACEVLTGHDIKLHPPKALETYNERTHRREMYGSDHYPTVIGAGPVLSYEQISERGQGPQWILQNWAKDWRYAQCSVGELSWLCGIGPVPMVNYLGRDTVLQLTWMRWALAYWAGTYRGEREWLLSQPIRFPAIIPAWAEIRKRLQRGLPDVVTYEPAGVDAYRGGLPPDWQPYAAKSQDTSKGVSTQPAMRPWVEPPREWGLEGVIEAHGSYWPSSPWAKAVESEFARGREIKRKQEARMITSTPPERRDLANVPVIYQRHW